jgi:hypothetical protein
MLRTNARAQNPSRFVAQLRPRANLKPSSRVCGMSMMCFRRFSNLSKAIFGIPACTALSMRWCNPVGAMFIPTSCYSLSQFLGSL